MVSATKRPLTIFWLAVTVAVIALGFAWTAWKATDTNSLAIVVAMPASVVCAAATLIAGRILTVVSRASHPQDSRARGGLRRDPG